MYTEDMSVEVIIDSMCTTGMECEISTAIHITPEARNKILIHKWMSSVQGENTYEK